MALANPAPPSSYPSTINNSTSSSTPALDQSMLLQNLSMLANADAIIGNNIPTLATAAMNLLLLTIQQQQQQSQQHYQHSPPPPHSPLLTRSLASLLADDRTITTQPHLNNANANIASSLFASPFGQTTTTHLSMQPNGYECPSQQQQQQHLMPTRLEVPPSSLIQPLPVVTNQQQQLLLLEKAICELLLAKKDYNALAFSNPTNCPSPSLSYCLAALASSTNSSLQCQQQQQLLVLPDLPPNGNARSRTTTAALDYCKNKEGGNYNSATALLLFASRNGNSATKCRPKEHQQPNGVVGMDDNQQQHQKGQKNMLTSCNNGNGNNNNSSMLSHAQLVDESVARSKLGRSYNPGRPLGMLDRQKILDLYQKGLKISHIAKVIGVTHSCVSKIMTRYRRTGSIHPRSASSQLPAAAISSVRRPFHHHHQSPQAIICASPSPPNRARTMAPKTVVFGNWHQQQQQQEWPPFECSIPSAFHQVSPPTTTSMIGVGNGDLAAMHRMLQLCCCSSDEEERKSNGNSSSTNGTNGSCISHVTSHAFGNRKMEEGQN